MLYYEFTLYYRDGRRTVVTVLQEEFQDQLLYCQTGIDGGWLEYFDYECMGYDN